MGSKWMISNSGSKFYKPWPKAVITLDCVASYLTFSSLHGRTIMVVTSWFW